MIIAVTISAAVQYIDTDMILFAYDDSGLKLVIATLSVQNNPALEIFESNSVQAPTLPSYADFVTATSNDGFTELTHATYGDVCVNLSRIKRLQAIDASNTSVMFGNYNIVECDDTIVNIQAAINAAARTVRIKSVDLVSDGTGVITLPDNYTSGTWNFFLRGVLVRRATITETAPNQLTYSGITKLGDYINVNYEY